jgi:hypothetical protein
MDLELVDKLDGRKKGQAYVSTLNLDQIVGPVCLQLERLISDGEQVNVLRPFRAYRVLKRLHAELIEIQPSAQKALAECLRRMGDPVEGAPAMDSAWLQGWATASGFASVTRLNVASSTAGATLDRKTAYSLTAFSLYFAVVSFVVSCIFGFLSLPSA